MAHMLVQLGQISTVTTDAELVKVSVENAVKGYYYA